MAEQCAEGRITPASSTQAPGAGLDDRVARHVEAGIDPHHAVKHGEGRARPACPIPIESRLGLTGSQRHRVHRSFHPWSGRRGSPSRLDPPARAVGAVLQNHPERGQAIADLVGQCELLLLAEPGAELEQELEKRGGQAVARELGPGRRLAEKSQKLAELAEHRDCRKIFRRWAGGHPRGHSVDGVDDLEELSESPSGVEIVVHRLEETLAMLGDLGGRAGSGRGVIRSPLGALSE